MSVVMGRTNIADVLRWRAVDDGLPTLDCRRVGTWFGIERITVIGALNLAHGIAAAMVSTQRPQSSSVSKNSSRPHDLATIACVHPMLGNQMGSEGDCACSVHILSI